MKKIYIKIWVVLFALAFLMGCVSTEKKKPITTESIEIGALQPLITQAVLAADAIKTGNIESLPFAIVDSNSKIVIDKVPGAFTNRSLLIGNYYTNPEEPTALSFATESQDIYGRIDRRITKIIYRTPKPNSAQTQDIKAWLLKQNVSSLTKTGGISREDLINFQKEKGLSPDGQFGPMTAKALAQDFSMIHVESLESRIFYPEIPNHMVFILPYDVFEKEKGKTKGFESWLEVGKLGISKDEFKNTAKKGDKFILFVYFFDRINPAYGISVDFATSAKVKGNTLTKPYHTKKGNWPVIAKNFTVDDKLPETLYLNIFLKKSSFKSPCIGSHKLL